MEMHLHLHLHLITLCLENVRVCVCVCECSALEVWVCVFVSALCLGTGGPITVLDKHGTHVPCWRARQASQSQSALDNLAFEHVSQLPHCLLAQVLALFTSSGSMLDEVRYHHARRGTVRHSVVKRESAES